MRGYHSRCFTTALTLTLSAVAEVMAWVYRVNRWRYYAEQNQA